MLRSWYVAFFQLPGLPEWALSAADFAWLRTSLTRTSRPGTFLAQDFERYGRAWSQPDALTSMLNWYRALPRDGRLPRSQRIYVPVCMIWGDRDPFLDRRLAEAGVTLCDHGEVVHLLEATHWVHLESRNRTG